MDKALASRRARIRRRRKFPFPSLERLEDRIVLSGAPPTAVNDVFNVTVNNVLNVSDPGVLANDTDPEGDPLTAKLFSGVQHGSLTLNANGSFTYTPDLNYSGIDSFTYQAKDGTGTSGLAAVTIHVKSGNNSPVAQNDAYSVDEDNTLLVNAAAGVLDNDTDADGDPLTAVLVAGPASGSLTLNPDGSFEYTPAANFNGNDSFTYRANDGANPSNTATVTITVDPINDAPVANNNSYNVDEDNPLVIDAPGVLSNDTDVDGDPLTAVLDSGPSNGVLTLNPNGSFTYTPNLNFHGSDTFTYQADDGDVLSNVATVTITVDSVNDPPDASNDSYSVDEDNTLTVAAAGVLANDTDVDGDPLTAVLVSGPTNGSLTLNADGSFSYTPDPDFFGTDGFTYVASDGSDDSNVAAVTINVAPIQDEPVAENDSYNVDEDNTLTVAAAGVLTNDTDVDGDPLTAVLVSGPTSGSVTLNADGSFSYTPDPDFFGTDGFTYVANDGADDSNVAAVTIIVNPVNDAPVAENDSYNVDEDNTLTVAAAGVLANDIDVDGDPLTASLVSGPTNGSVTLNADGSFSYTPDPDFFGTDGFTYVANDGAGDSNVAAVTIIVNPVNDAPVGENDSYNVDEDNTLTVAAAGVLANDTDVDGDPLTASLISGPTNGSLTLNADGSFSYTPDPDFFGTDGFTYVANDGAADSNVTAVTIIVNPVNDAPVGENDTYDVDEDNTLTVAAAGVLANDTDVEGDPLTASLISGPTNGSLTLNADGSFSYTPDPDFFGTDGFTYVANDGAADSNVTAVTIIVNPINDAPVGENDSYNVDEDNTLTVAAAGVLANDTDVDGDPLEAVLVSGPTHGALSLSPDGSFVYTPDPDFNGTDGFTYIATDGIEDSAVTAVTIIVNPVNDAPVGENDSYNVDEDNTLTVAAAGVLANDTDVDGDPLTASLISGPTNGSLSLNADGSFTYTPDPDFFGTDGFTYVANDGSVDSNVTAVTIIVNPVNDPPVAENDVFNVVEDNTLTVDPLDSILNNDTDVEGDPLTASLISGPTNGSLSLNADGSFTYTPDPDFFGTDGFSYVANDGSDDSNVAAVTIVVNPVQDPPVAENDQYEVDEDNTLVVDAPSGVLANDIDVDGDPLTADLVSGPTNGTLTGNPDGSFTYTPNPNFFGTDGFTYIANDGTSDSNVAAVTIIVHPVNDAPLAHNDAYSVGEDNTLIVLPDGVLLNDFDFDGDPLQAVLVSGPANGVLTLNSDGSFEYDPDADFFGVDSFTYFADDGDLVSATVTVTITVDPVNDPPIVEDDYYEGKIDTPLVIDALSGILSNDFDVEGDVLTAIHLVGPLHGVLTLNADGSFTYTPNPGFEGEDGFIYQAFDGKANSGLGFVEISIFENEAPSAEDDEYETDEDTPLVVDAAGGLLDNDHDGDGDPLTAILVTGPANGVVTLNADGSFTYTPNADFNGTDSFTYQADDGALFSNEATVTINVAPVNDAPHAQDESYDADEDQTLNVNAANGVLANDSDPEGDPLTAVLVTSTSNGSLTLHPDGSFTYTPDPGFSGTDTFTYQADDGNDLSNIATVDIFVDPAFNSPPTAVNDSYAIDEDTVLTVAAPGVLANDTDPQGDPLTAVLSSGPSNGVLTLNPDGSFTYTPNPGFFGRDSFVYRANDGQFNSTLAAVTIRVIEAEAEGEQPLALHPAAAGAAQITASLSAADLGSTALAALSLWSSVAPGHSLGAVSLGVADLPGGLLALAGQGRILIDADAAGRGWFVDATPAAHEEFRPTTSAALVARHDGPAAGRVDLLTVVLHEMGHLLGRSHTDALGGGDLMESLLLPGMRKLPVVESLDELFANDAWSA